MAEENKGLSMAGIISTIGGSNYSGGKDENKGVPMTGIVPTIAPYWIEGMEIISQRYNREYYATEAAQAVWLQKVKEIKELIHAAILKIYPNGYS